MISKLLKLNALGLHAVLGTHCEQVLAKSEKSEMQTTSIPQRLPYCVMYE